MAYGKKYTCDFTNGVTSYTLEIYEKNYGGAVIPVTESNMIVKHRWDTDDPKAPIKGSSIAISIINEGTLPLTDFYSVDDEQFKAKVVWHADLNDITLFEGFIVQDDSGELVVDYRHPIELSATDNLGLLKDIPFNEAKIHEYESFDGEAVTIEGIAPHTLKITNIDKVLQAGDLISITGTLSGVYHIEFISGDNYIVEESVTTEAAEAVTLIWFKKDFYTFRSLISFIKTCLSSTGLELQTRVFANINEVTQADTECFLLQTLLDPQTFYDGSNWNDCYTVLTKILERFKLTLFQAKGYWNIIRWSELRYNDYSIPGYLFDTDFTYLNATPLNEAAGMFGGWNKFLIGINETSVAETGLRTSIIRPNRYTQETFNYRFPPDLPRNTNFQELGDLITDYADGSNHVYEYQAPWWFYTDAYPSPSGVNGPAEFFIRIIKDNLGNEIERYMVVKDNDIHSYPIPAAAGDIIKFSFRCKTPDDFTSISAFVKLTDGTDTVFAHAKPDSPSWDTTTGYTITDTITADEWFFVEIETRPVSFDGVITLYLRTWSTSGSGENLYTDLRVGYLSMINQSTKITGHVHKTDQSDIPKNNEKREINIDVSPRNSVLGTLFLDSSTGVLQDRCGQWTRLGESESRNLGDIITFEEEYLRRLPRTKLEGTVYGLLSAEQSAGPSTIHDHLSLITVLQHTFFDDLNFIFGRLEIDYSNNRASGTIDEMYKDGEEDSDLTSEYSFKYLYQTK